MKETLVQLDQRAEQESGVMEAQVYEEIRDTEMKTTAETVAHPRAAASSAVPQYEEVMPVGVGSKSRDSYQITLCEAYGVTLSK